MLGLKLNHVSKRGALVILDVTTNSHRYIQILTDHMLPWVKGVFVQNFLFVQDNDPPDVARDTVALLDQYDVDVMDWIARSPDMNPIEQVWNLLPIWPNCVKSWGGGGVGMGVVVVVVVGGGGGGVGGLRTLVESIPSRLRAVLVAKGAALLIITLHRLFHDLSIHLICCFSRASRGPYII